MSKRVRLTLKDYLKTGEVRLEALPGFRSPPSPPKSGGAEGKDAAPGDESGVFLGLLSESDRRMWEAALHSGTKIRRLPFDAAALREDFRLMDRTRFTYYILDERNAPLRPVRTSVQIREPFVLLLKWDETGALDIYGLS
ncbi:MAG: hypothetical protein LBO82_01465 [Synergistaceae bacterium]|jgi:hypothetical protein|nr:hypothetical protein [Synergistaceae bacterium]